jgi:hypothetical protein
MAGKCTPQDVACELTHSILQKIDGYARVENVITRNKQLCKHPNEVAGANDKLTLLTPPTSGYGQTMQTDKSRVKRDGMDGCAHRSTQAWFVLMMLW